MKTTEITAALLQGSKNIDRMREETHQLVSMIIGVALRPFKFGTEFIENFESPDCRWRFCCKTGPVGYLRVECWTLVPGTSDKILLYTHNDGYYSGTTGDIQTVYERIPIFVEGMMNKFPDITERWQFLINASKVKFY